MGSQLTNARSGVKTPEQTQLRFHQYREPQQNGRSFGRRRCCSSVKARCGDWLARARSLSPTGLALAALRQSLSPPPRRLKSPARETGATDLQAGSNRRPKSLAAPSAPIYELASKGGKCRGRRGKQSRVPSPRSEVGCGGERSRLTPEPASATLLPQPRSGGLPPDTGDPTPGLSGPGANGGS